MERIHLGVRWDPEEYQYFLDTLRRARKIFPFSKSTLIRFVLGNPDPAFRREIENLIRRYPPERQAGEYRLRAAHGEITYSPLIMTQKNEGGQ